MARVLPNKAHRKAETAPLVGTLYASVRVALLRKFEHLAQATKPAAPSSVAAGFAVGRRPPDWLIGWARFLGGGDGRLVAPLSAEDVQLLYCSVVETEDIVEQALVQFLANWVSPGFVSPNPPKR